VGIELRKPPQDPLSQAGRQSWWWMFRVEMVREVSWLTRI